MKAEVGNGSGTKASLEMMVCSRPRPGLSGAHASWNCAWLSEGEPMAEDETEALESEELDRCGGCRSKDWVPECGEPVGLQWARAGPATAEVKLCAFKGGLAKACSCGLNPECVEADAVKAPSR